MSDTVLTWPAIDTAHVLTRPYNICGEASARLYVKDIRVKK